MLILLIAYAGGVLTILSPCILPVLPFVFARADRPFRSHGLPMLVGMALSFALVATLASIGGAWVVSANEYGRYAAMALLLTFGLTLVWPGLSERMSRPLVTLGSRLSEARPRQGSMFGSLASSLLLGVGTGLLWAPCAGPILGLILTGAALNGASVETAWLLLAYASGAGTSLGAALLLGRRLQLAMRRSGRATEWLRRGAGVAVVAGVGAIVLGLDTGLLSRLSVGTTYAIEEKLVGMLNESEGSPRSSAEAEADVNSVDLAMTVGFPMAAKDVRSEGDLPSLKGATEWINSPPLSPETLRGKVVLIDFWTYSCINCLRTVPYVRAWAEKYKDAGLVVIGVHSPEFAFEKRSANVRRAVSDLGIAFPVAVDSDFAIWRAFGNRYWPAFYLVDAQGRVRHHQFGEGQYDKSERVIQALLMETGRPPTSADLVSVHGAGTQAAPGQAAALSNESYLGYQQAQGFVSPGGIVTDQSHSYRDATLSRRNDWSLSGNWIVERDGARLVDANGRIAFRFQARDLHLVLGPSADGKPIRFRVRIDGGPPLADHGTDTDAQGNGIVDDHRLYQLVRQGSVEKDRVFEIEFLDRGAQAYVFTFG